MINKWAVPDGSTPPPDLYRIETLDGIPVASFRYKSDALAVCRRPTHERYGCRVVPAGVTTCKGCNKARVAEAFMPHLKNCWYCRAKVAKDD